MAGFHTQIRVGSGYPFEDSQITVKLSGTVAVADIGKALTQDVTVANTMKLAGDGDPIAGYLFSLENRLVEGQVVGVCAFRFAKALPIKAALAGQQVVVIGSRLCGAGAGEVRAIDLSGTPTTPNVLLAAHAPRVWAVNGLVADATKI